jgi:hypothetical protein
MGENSPNLVTLADTKIRFNNFLMSVKLGRRKESIS